MHMWRTYLPTIIKTLTFLCKFIAAHRTRIIEVIGDENVPTLDALTTACDVFMAVIVPLNTRGG
jgi:hypothetical protein